MTKQVKINKKVHERLTCLKSKTNAKSINDVIIALINIGEEQYLHGTIHAKGKKILLDYDDGKLVTIKITKK